MKLVRVLLFPAILAAADATVEPAMDRLFDTHLNSTQRATACFELRGDARPEAIAALGRAIADPELAVCAAADLRMVKAGAELRRALDDPRPEARAAAARELGALNNPADLEALSRAARDPNLLVASNALAGLSAYTDPAVEPYLRDLAAAGGMIGDMALERLGAVNSAEAATVARKLLASTQVPDQLYAIRALAQYGDASDKPALQKIAATNKEDLAQRGRGFGLMPPLNLGKAARAALADIDSRGR